MEQSYSNLCQQYAQILGGKGSFENGVCSVSIPRNFQAQILGRPSHGELSIEISFESMDSQGRALNLGEWVLIEEEVQGVLSTLQSYNLIVSALHNHWMFDQPRLMYLHCEAVIEPLSFARIAAETLKTLKV